MLLLLTLFTFTSFDGVVTLQILQRYSLSVIFMKFTNTGEAFLYCEELVLLAFIKANFMHRLIQSKIKTDIISKISS